MMIRGFEGQKHCRYKALRERGQSNLHEEQHGTTQKSWGSLWFFVHAGDIALEGTPLSTKKQGEAREKENRFLNF